MATPRELRTLPDPARRFVALVALALAFVAASCSRDGDDDDDGVPFDINAFLDATDTQAAPSYPPDYLASRQPPEGGDERIEYLVEALPVTLRDGLSEPFSFEVPDGTASVLLYVRGETDVQHNVHHWVDPTGREIVYEDWYLNRRSEALAPIGCAGCLNRTLGTEHAFATLVPNNEASTLEAGTHTVRLLGFEVVDESTWSLLLANEELLVDVVAKRGPTVPDTGVLDINFWFTGAGGWTAETAPTDPAFIRAVAGLEEILAEQGVSLGVLSYADSPRSFRIIENVAGLGSDLGRLFASSAEAPRNAVNVFLVGELQLGFGLDRFGVVLGQSGGLPGPVLVQGTTGNGVAVAVDAHALYDIMDELDVTIAHELGHLLGLFHTSENNRFRDDPVHDPIADTPQNDASYLMYFSPNGSKLSDEQGRVLRANPWVRHP